MRYLTLPLHQTPNRFAHRAIRYYPHARGFVRRERPVPIPDIASIQLNTHLLSLPTAAHRITPVL